MRFFTRLGRVRWSRLVGIGAWSAGVVGLSLAGSASGSGAGSKLSPSSRPQPVITPGRLSKEPRLKDKVCIISGASRGFGQAIAVRFVEEGAKVVLLARGDMDETLSLISKIEGVGPSRVGEVALWANCDLADEQSIQKAIALTHRTFGPAIHVLVNNAALFIFRSVEDATAADWDASNAVNIKGHALLTKHALPGLRAAGSSSVVFQGSISSFKAQPNCATYATTKAAIVQLARNCAYDLAKYGVRVNTVCAGTVETPISSAERSAHGWNFDQWAKLKTQDVILRRIGHVREVANATLFFASDESSYCTATHLMVDGGQEACTVMTD